MHSQPGITILAFFLLWRASATKKSSSHFLQPLVMGYLPGGGTPAHLPNETVLCVALSSSESGGASTAPVGISFSFIPRQVVGILPTFSFYEGAL